MHLMADQTSNLPRLTPLESRALDLVTRSDDLHAHAEALDLTFEQLVELITESNIRLYVEALREFTWQLRQIHAYSHHQDTLKQLSDIASDRANDAALRLRACITIIKGVPASPPHGSGPPLRSLPSRPRSPGNDVPPPPPTDSPSPRSDEPAARSSEPAIHGFAIGPAPQHLAAVHPSNEQTPSTEPHTRRSNTPSSKDAAHLEPRHLRAASPESVEGSATPSISTDSDEGPSCASPVPIARPP